MTISPNNLHDAESFGAFFSRSQLIIFRYIYGIHGGPIEEVEDLTSDAFTRAWKGREHFAGDEHDALCWMFTISRNLVIDAYRKRKTHRDRNDQNLDAAMMETMIPDPQRSLEERTILQQEIFHLMGVLQRIPVDRREMLVLRYIVGWKVKDIASYMNMEENTISVYMRRSLEQIRAEWKKI
jgi:RNA polymerase sigma-70 factor (ECF subfamily)